MRYWGLILLLFCTACRRDGSDAQALRCNAEIGIANFDQVKKSLTYENVRSIFKQEGELFSDNGVTKIYKWYYVCSGLKRYVQCQFQNDRVTLVAMTLTRDICAYNLSVNYPKVQHGMTYAQVKHVFGADGDNFRNDYQYRPGGHDTRYYRWYNCDAPAKYAEVWFSADTVVLTRKLL